MSEYIIKTHQPHPQLATDPEQKLHRVFDWKQQKKSGNDSLTAIIEIRAEYPATLETAWKDLPVPTRFVLRY